jgi:hypothetical protein
MSPAALHVDVSARGRRFTDAPRDSGYDDPHYLTWTRTTVAHNTVTVDESPMFPYDSEGDSIWEADRWRDNISDGRLEGFQPGPGFRAIRASNENVYPGVRLDRTLVLTDDYLLDVFRVAGEGEHRYDWAAHLVGGVVVPSGASAVDLGGRRGYCHLTDARQWPRPPAGAPATPIAFAGRQGASQVLLLTPEGADIVVARDPLPADPAKPAALGEVTPPEPRTALLVRVRARDALFVALWAFGAPRDEGVRLVEGAARCDLVIAVRANGRSGLWRLPIAPDAAAVAAG